MRTSAPTAFTEERTVSFTETVRFLPSAGQLKGRALGALALGGGAVAAAHLDGRQGAAAAGLAVIGAAADAALNVGVAGLIVFHSKNPPFKGWC